VDSRTWSLATAERDDDARVELADGYTSSTTARL
jgi:hypothetical protein